MKKEKRKTIWVLAIASFLNDFGSDAIYPIWPLFVTTVLGANVAVLGLIDGIGDAVSSLSQAASGYLSDRVRKRKVFVWAGYGMGGLSRIGYALSTAWQHLIPFRILDRFGKIRGAPRDAIVADASTRANRGRNFGLMRMMDNLGAVCGIITAILLLGYLGYRNLFLLVSIPSFFGVALIIIFIKERKAKGLYKGISFKNLSPNLLLFLLSSAFLSIGFFSYSFLLVYSWDFGFSAYFVPVLYLVFTVVAMIMSLPFGKLADKWNRKGVLVLASVFFILMSLGFIFAQSQAVIILSFVFYGLHLAARMPVQTAFVSELSEKKYRASTIGAFQMVVGLCALPASVIAGLLWISFGKAAPFYLSLAATIVSLALLMLVKENKKGVLGNE